MAKEVNLEEIFNDIIAVHITNFLPKNNKIRTRFSVDPRNFFRDTIHFCLNNAVSDLSSLQTPSGQEANWSDKTFAILIPFNGLYKLNGRNLLRLSPEDTFFKRNIILPEGTIVLITPNGLEDAIKKEITSLEELSFNFGDMAERNITKTKFFEKTIGVITYRIFNYHTPLNIEQAVLETITEKSYSIKFFDRINISEINKLLGLEASPHYTHWIAQTEKLLMTIKYNEYEIDNILRLIAKLGDNGIIYPITYKEYGEVEHDLRILEKKNANFIDNTGKLFNTSEVNIQFSDQEMNVIEYIHNSLYQIGVNIVQKPLQLAKIMLKEERHGEYYKAIRFYIREYQKYVKIKLPKKLIELFPQLTELVNEKI